MTKPPGVGIAVLIGFIALSFAIGGFLGWPFGGLFFGVFMLLVAIIA